MNEWMGGQEVKLNRSSWFVSISLASGGEGGCSCCWLHPVPLFEEVLLQVRALAAGVGGAPHSNTGCGPPIEEWAMASRKIKVLTNYWRLLSMSVSDYEPFLYEKWSKSHQFCLLSCEIV